MKSGSILEKSTMQRLGQFAYNNLIILGIICLCVYAAIVQPRFLSFNNLRNVLQQMGPLSLPAIGMTFVIIAGYIDLSIVGMFSFVSVFTISLIPVTGEVPAMLLGMLLGTLCGLLDGAVVSFVGVRDDGDAVFVTYAMSMIFFAFALLWSNGSTIRITTDAPITDFIGSGKLLGLPVSVYIFAVTLLLAHLFLMKTQTGMEIRMSGGNRKAARLCGISKKKAIYLSYAILGLTVAMGSIIQFARTTTAGPVIGTGYDTNAILSVVIGGTRLKGGLGSVLRTTIGIVVITLMSNAMNMIGVSTNLQDLFKGLILILAIWLDYRRK